MPTYDYECNSCGYHFEKLQSIKADPIKECPECGREVKRLIGGGLGIIFKGSGFYTTDYKRSSANTPGKDNKDNSKESKTEKKADTKTENKTEKKTGEKTEKKKETITA